MTRVEPVRVPEHRRLKQLAEAIGLVTVWPAQPREVPADLFAHQARADLDRNGDEDVGLGAAIGADRVEDLRGIGNVRASHKINGEEITHRSQKTIPRSSA